MSVFGVRALLHAAAGGALAASWAAAAGAADAALAPAEERAAPARIELIGSSRLGCGAGPAPWSVTSDAASNCAFDQATRGARVAARHETGFGWFETYATIARTATGAFTPDQLLAPAGSRRNVTSDLLMIGLKGSALDDRVKLTAEFARTDNLVGELSDRGWALAESRRRDGSSALIRLDAKLADQPGLKWSLSGEYRSVGKNYAVGRSPELFGHYALPGTRMSLASRARIGQVGLSAAVEQSDTVFGTSASRRAGIDAYGLSLRLVSRESEMKPQEVTSLATSRTWSSSANADLDLGMLAATLLPELGDLPFLVPTNVSVSHRSGETDSRYQTRSDRYRRSSLGIDGSWETPIGETSLSYWRDDRSAITAGGRSGRSETYQLYHWLQRGNWRFGIDASLSRSRFEGAGGYDDRSLSFGQSVAYSAPNGPELRLQLGQDRGGMRLDDDSYSSLDRYSQITASLDLSRYLQARFERSDLKLTLDYRKTVDRSDAEIELVDETIERWVDGDRREGFLVSFGMKL